jgi:hypothetical protein
MTGSDISKVKELLHDWDQEISSNIEAMIEGVTGACFEGRDHRSSQSIIKILGGASFSRVYMMYLLIEWFGD